MILGAAIGWMRAARRGGNRADKVHYALAHAILFAILGLFATILYHRLS
jgi:hypothetical protein